MSKSQKSTKKDAPDSREKPFTSLSDDIAKNLLRKIIAGNFSAGEKLPTERALAEQFGVARQVVRESLKYLQALGAVSIRKRVGIIVNDLPINCFFEHFELFLVNPDGSINTNCLKEILDFRNNNNEPILRAAALNRTDADVKEMKKLVQEYKKAKGNQERLMSIMSRYMKAVSKASHNRMYEMLTNTTANVLLNLQSLILGADVPSYEAVENMEQVTAAIEQRDADIASILGSRALKKVDQRIMEAVVKFKSAKSLPA